MKKRIFYVVNLDRNRILVLAIIAAGFLGISFATGYRLANNGSLHSPVALQADLNGPNGGLKEPITENGEVTLRREEASSRGEELDQGSSIYETDREGTSGGARENGGTMAARRSLNATDNSSDGDSGRNADDERDRSTAREERSRSSSSGKSHKKKSSTSKHSSASSKKRSDRAKKETTEKVSKREKEHKRSKKKTANHDTETKKKTTRKEKQREQASSSSTPAPAAQPVKSGKTEHRKQDPRAAVLDYRESSVKMANVAPSATPKPAPAASTDPASSRSQSGYTLQLGAFTTRGPADRMVETLKKRGFPATVVHTSSHYLVRVGSASDRNGLAPLEAKLKKEHYSYLILKK